MALLLRCTRGKGKTPPDKTEPNAERCSVSSFVGPERRSLYVFCAAERSQLYKRNQPWIASRAFLVIANTSGIARNATRNTFICNEYTRDALSLSNFHKKRAAPRRMRPCRINTHPTSTLSFQFFFFPLSLFPMPREKHADELLSGHLRHSPCPAPSNRHNE